MTGARADEHDAIRGKVVLVTGSGRGLGAQLATRRLATTRTRGHQLPQRPAARAESLALEVQQRGGEALVCRADVADYDQARGLVDETLKAFGRLDVLVNAVGAFSWKPVADMPTRRMAPAARLQPRLRLPHVPAGAPHMRRNHWGRIVNLGAVGAERALGPAAGLGLLGRQGGGDRVLALAGARGGPLRHHRQRGLARRADGRRRRATPGSGHAPDILGDRVPVGRSGSPDDVVRAVYFFVSPAADFLTGQVLAVAGGWQL